MGGYQAGEGIVGIPYALTVAGNKDTVMSLWKVDDEATAEFTSAVFEKLSKGKSEVAALNETKREFLQSTNPKFKAPSVWAAFILYGI
ncbi:MAG: CHAT domain-containing protein [Quinella sp. 3Q1]|nr:CHAT domain-containing protein [Quinella sp. 3Q1]